LKKFVIYIPILIMMTFIFFSCANENATANYDIEYLDKLNVSLQTIIANISDLNNSMETLNLDDETWTSAFNTKVDDISSSINKTTNITFPESESDLKKSYETILLNLYTGLEELKLSCQTKNIDDFNKGVKYINNSIEIIKTLDDKLK